MPRRGASQSLAPLAAIVAFAAAVRTIAWLRTEAIFNDGPIYIELAQKLAGGRVGEVVAHPYHPLYPAAIAAVQTVVPSWEGAAVLVSIAAGCAAVALLHGLVRDTFDRPTADVAAILLAVHPWAVRQASDVQSDGPYLAGLLAAVWLLWRAWRSGRSALAFGAGVASGLAYWIRPEGLGVGIVGVALGAGAVVWGGWGLRRGLAWCAVLAFATAATAAPLIVAVHDQTGIWAITQKKSAAAFVGWSGASAAPSGAPTAPAAAGPATEPARPEAGHLQSIGVLIDRVFTTGRLDVLLCLVLGCVALRGRPGPRGWFVLALVGSYALVLEQLHQQAGYVSRRHVLPPLSLSFGYAAVGLAWGSRWLVERLPQRARALRPLWLGVALAAVIALPSDLASYRDNRIAVRRAAEWLAESSEIPGPVGARRRRVAYYAGAPFVLLPKPDTEPLVAYLRTRGVHHVVIDEEHIASYPELREPERFGLRVIHRTRAAGRGAAVFALPRSGADPGNGVG